MITKSILLLILFNISALFLKLISLFVYPISYLFRNKLRKYIYFKDQKGLELHEENCSVITKVLWFFLDDSIWLENIREHKTNKEYCIYGKKNWLVEKLSEGKLKEFLRSYYWGAIRNSNENLLMYIAFGKLLYVRKYIKNNFIEFRIGRHLKTIYPIPFLDIYLWKLHLSTGFYKGNGKFKALTLKR